MDALCLYNDTVLEFGEFSLLIGVEQRFLAKYITRVKVRDKQNRNGILTTQLPKPMSF